MTTIKCICGHDNNDGRKFCVHCGQRLLSGEAVEKPKQVSQKIVCCPKCDFQNTSDVLFCKSCGVNIKFAKAFYKNGRIELSSGLTVLADNINKVVTNDKTGQPLKLLDDVTFVAMPYEFILVLGQSGCGKSTLLDVLNGRRPATSGNVLINGIDLYRKYSLFKNLIGYVPQKDIVHQILPVRNALYYSAKLRLDGNLTETETDQLIDDVLNKIEMKHRETIPIHNLSGGQIKRVSLGTELICNPQLLFLDEPTSGLDAGTEENMMKLFRSIADTGKSVICITHTLDNVDIADFIYILDQGKLVFCGKGTSALKYFEIESINKIYSKIKESTPEKLKEKFSESVFHQKLIEEKKSAINEIVTSKNNIAAYTDMLEKQCDSSKNNLEFYDWLNERVKNFLNKYASKRSFKQLFYLTVRYCEITFRDYFNLLILLSLSIIIGPLIGLVMKDKNPEITIVLAVISCMFFGCFNSCREIVKEQDIYKRERSVCIEIIPYLFSKIIVTSSIAVVQTLLFASVIYYMCDLSGGFFANYLILLITSFIGVQLGLLISAIASSADKALSLLPLILLPQVVVAVKFALEGFDFGKRWCMELFSQVFIFAYWAVDTMRFVEKIKSRNSLQPDNDEIFQQLCTFSMASFLYFLACLILMSYLMRRKDTL